MGSATVTGRRDFVCPFTEVACVRGGCKLDYCLLERRAYGEELNVKRATWECPETGEQCSSPSCSRNYCSNKRAKAFNAMVDKQMKMTAQAIQHLKTSFNLTDEEWDEIYAALLEERNRKRQP
jgi:hypothetical protein